MPSWVQPCGAPLLSVICKAYMRVPTKRILSMGQNITTPLPQVSAHFRLDLEEEAFAAAVIGFAHSPR